jgi:N-acetylglucosamine-6-sulfatase
MDRVALRRALHGLARQLGSVSRALRARSRLRSLVVLAAALALLGPLVLTRADDLNAAPVQATPADRDRPDVVLILTDDQRTDSLLAMPAVKSLLVDRGTRFTEAIVPSSICCPSRATILTGRYSHGTGVWENGGPQGGWRTFHRLGNEQRTIARTLHRADYRTGLIGKYLNGFGRWSPPSYVPPGWNRFEGFILPRTSGAYYDYNIGRTTRYGAGGSDYSTDVLATRAVDFIWSTPKQKSLFLYFAPFAPHSPYAPAPRDLGSLHGVLPSYRPASVTAPVTDKPAWVRARPPSKQSRIDYIRERQGESLMAVDDAVAAIVAALEHSGRLKDTMIVFMSDNGLQIGEHHIIGKNVPYRQATSVPLVIRWDGRLRAGAVDNRLASNVDVAPTIADAAGTPFEADGSSLLGSTRRDGSLLEASFSRRYGRPAYCGWRTPSWMYVRYATGEEELYSYATDPEELRNLATDPVYAGQLAAMKARAVKACRPMPPTFHW